MADSDDELLAELAEVIDEVDPVPQEVIDAAKAIGSGGAGQADEESGS